jgi:hypothetical protein
VMVSVAMAFWAVVRGRFNSRAAARTPPLGLPPLGFEPSGLKTSCSCSHSRMYRASCWSRLHHLALFLVRQIRQAIEAGASIELGPDDALADVRRDLFGAASGLVDISLAAAGLFCCISRESPLPRCRALKRGNGVPTFFARQLRPIAPSRVALIRIKRERRLFDGRRRALGFPCRLPGNHVPGDLYWAQLRPGLRL